MPPFRFTHGMRGSSGMSTEHESGQGGASADARPEVSVIIVSWNTLDLVLDCIESIHRETVSDHEIILIDNASADGTAEVIAQRHPEVRLIANQDNRGFAAANNQGIEIAQGRLVLLLNPDTVILDHGIDKLMEFAEERPEARIWGSRTVFRDRSINPSYWKFMSVTSLTLQVLGLNSMFRKSRICNPESMSLWTKNEEDSVDWITGCFMLLKKSFWEELNGFSPIYFMYGEETDLCLRAIKRGARPRATTNATIIHLGGASEKIRVDATIRIIRAKVQLIKDHFHPVKKPLGMMLFKAWPWSRMFAHGILKLLGRKSSALPHSEWGEIVKRRSEWQKGFVN